MRLIIFILLFVPTVALCESVHSDRVAVTLLIEKGKYGIATKSFLNHDASQFMLRYDVTDKWHTQYRYVTSNAGERVEHRARFEHSTFKKSWVDFKNVFEFRFKESDNDTLRYRPKLKLQYPKLFYHPFYSYIPHFEFKEGESGYEYKFGEHQIGVKFKASNADISFYYEVHSDEHWHNELSFFGLGVSASI